MYQRHSQIAGVKETIKQFTIFYVAPKCIYDTQFQNNKNVLKNL